MLDGKSIGYERAQPRTHIGTHAFLAHLSRYQDGLAVLADVLSQHGEENIASEALGLQSDGLIELFGKGSGLCAKLTTAGWEKLAQMDERARPQPPRDAKRRPGPGLGIKRLAAIEQERERQQKFYRQRLAAREQTTAAKQQESEQALAEARAALAGER